jgi:pilus assembly protein CpaF
MHDLFVYEREGLDGNKVRGRFRAMGIRPKAAEMLKTAGIELAPEMFAV